VDEKEQHDMAVEQEMAETHDETGAPMKNSLCAKDLGRPLVVPADANGSLRKTVGTPASENGGNAMDTTTENSNHGRPSRYLLKEESQCNKVVEQEMPETGVTSSNGDGSDGEDYLKSPGKTYQAAFC